MNIRRRSAIVLVSLFLVVVGAAFTLDRNYVASQVADDDAELSRLALFDEVQTLDDRVSADVTGVAGILPLSTRFLGEANEVKYWLGLGVGNDEICFVVELPNGIRASASDAPVTGTICSDRSTFIAEGTSISVDGHTARHGVVAYVLPAGITSADVESFAQNFADASVISRSSLHIVALEPSKVRALAGEQVPLTGHEPYSFPELEVCGALCD